MAQKLSISFKIIFFLVLFFALSHSQTLSSSEALCDSTQYPPTCISILPVGSPSTVPGFARISLQKSLEASRDLLASIDQYYLGLPIPALDDCRLLAGLSVDYLTIIVGKTGLSDVLDVAETDYLYALFSAVLTNCDTCQDSILEVTTGEHDLLARVSDDMKLHSVSLALFRQAWVPEVARIKPRLLGETQFALKGRKLLEGPYFAGNDMKLNKTVTVNPNGTGDFTTINAAVDAAPSNARLADGYFVIYVVAGVYQEYVSIPSSRTSVMIVGDGIGRTIITGNKNFVDGSTTFASATLSVAGKGFIAVNITVQNTAGPSKHQAVAVRNGADMSVFYQCSFEGYQDTLYAHSLRQFYRECDIYGTVDFIFGNAATVFQKCNIFPKLPLQGQFNAITAQGRTDPNQNTGISVQNCMIKPSDELVYGNFSVKTYLGRPWKEYSRTVYLQNFMDGFIDPKGWIEWLSDFALNTLFYAEFRNIGPGSDTVNRVNWPGYRSVNETEAVGFTVSSFVQGDSWLPVTRVPYTSGLV